MDRRHVCSCLLLCTSIERTACHSMSTPVSERTTNPLLVDCEYQLKPVESGFRLALVYNLVNAGGKSKQIVKDKSRLTAKVSEAVQAWGTSAGGPKQGIYMLSNK